jgi:eukaryotic-like serine/threonine-protein kinase
MIHAPHISEHYALRGVLGRGGMSTVYEATDLLTSGDVAIKVIQLIGDDELLKRFFSELLLTAGVRHHNIVRIHDFGVTEQDGKPFIVMDRLHGQDLDSWLRAQGPMHAARFVPLFTDLLDAMALVHARGVVHKDIKPGNIFFSQPGTWDEALVVTDFGIAHSLESSRATRPGHLACTPQYSAPEYLNTQQVGPQLDVYQLGLVLCELLLGWPLVDEPSVLKCVIAHTEGRLNLPSRLRVGPLAEVIRRSLALDPAARFAHAGQMADALRAVDANALELQLELARR